MTRWKLSNCFYKTLASVFAVVAAISSVHAQTSIDTAKDSRSHALLIAISEYASSDVPDLEGSSNDIDLMKKVLADRFGVPTQNTITLINKEATHTAIERAFKDLDKRTSKGDFIYIHYSGHGSTIDDPKELRNQDQTWVSFGSRAKDKTGNDKYDVLDKEIRLWMEPLYAKTDDIIFVSDSCHSATVAKGLRTGTRAAPPDKSPHPLLAQLPRLAAPTTGLRIGAARDTESAVEIDPRSGRPCQDRSNCYGVFTWYWVQALQKAQPGDRWKDVFDRTATLVSTQDGIAQRPQMEGMSDRLIFGGNFAATGANLPVIEVRQDGTVKIGAGATSGVTKRSIYRLHGFQGSDPTKAPTLEISDVAVSSSTGKVTQGSFSAGDQVTETRHAYSFEPIRLYVGGDYVAGKDKSLAQSVRKALMDLPGYTVIDDRKNADWWIYMVRPKPQEGNEKYVQVRRLPESVPNAPPIAWVVSPQGVLAHENLQVALKEPDQGIRTLTKNLQKFAWAREVKTLAIHGSNLPVELSVAVNASDPAAKTFPFKEIPKPKFDDVLSFQLENKDQQNRSWYAYVFAITPSAAIKRLHPRSTDNEDEARLTKGQLLKVSTKYALDEPGTETLLLVVTERPVPPNTFEQTEYLSKKGDSKPKSQLEARLSAAAQRKGSGITDPETWGIVFAEYEITKKR